MCRLIITLECSLTLKAHVGWLDSTLLPSQPRNCTFRFSTIENNKFNKEQLPGLLIKLVRLNVPCDSGGFLRFNNSILMCGKLEEFPVDQRTLYFDSYVNTILSTYNHPKFNLVYQLVDYCYNTTILERNSSFSVQPNNLALKCHFKIHLPYGNQIRLNLQLGKKFEKIPPKVEEIHFTNDDDAKSTDDNFLISSDENSFNPINQIHCDDVIIEIMTRHNGKWSECIRKSKSHPNVIYSVTSNDNVLMIRITKSNQQNDIWRRSTTLIDDVSSYPDINIEYTAEPIDSLVSQCAFGSIAFGHFCLWSFNELRQWHEAENICKSFGGHLASIKSDYEQKLIDEMLLNR